MKKNLNILYINAAEERHGSSYRARALFRLLVSHGFNVYYVESNYKGDSNIISVSQKDSIFGYLFATLKRIILCIRFDYDILYFQKAWPFNLPCLLVAKLRGKKVAIDFDDLDSFWQSSKFRQFITAFSENWMPGLSDLITTHNQYLKRYLSEKSDDRKKVFLVPQGVDTTLFDPGRYNREDEKKRLGLSSKTVYCFLGSFTIGSAKDLHIILKAIKRVCQKRENTLFMIIGGGGPLQESYLGLIKELELVEDVLITGRVPQSKVPGYLAASDVGLVYMEDNMANRMRMSLKLMEYLAMELTVIGHIVGETHELFGRYCFLSEPGAEALSQTILRVTSKSLGKESARSIIQAHYDWRVIGHAMEKAIKGIR